MSRDTNMFDDTLPIFKARKASVDNPAHVVNLYRDAEGRHCTEYVCVCNSATRDTNADASLIARLLNQAYYEVDHE